MKTQKLIQELKEEIEKINYEIESEEEDGCSDCYNLRKKGMSDCCDYHFKELMKKQAQLQFAEKLIKAIKEDVEKISFGMLRDGRVKMDDGAYVDKKELNKILDEALK